MGNFYVNYTLRGPSQGAAAMALASRRASVTPQQNGCVVAFDAESDEQDQASIAELAADLSRKLRCTVLAVLNHDDDLLWYQLYERGDLIDEYDSSPSFTDEAAEPSPPVTGDAQRLCQAFGSQSVAAVEGILRKPSYGDEGYTCAVDRHADLVQALGLPNFAVGMGYEYLARGELPERLSADDMLDAE